MLRKHFKKRAPETPVSTINLTLLDENLDNIRIRMLEIRGFRKKKIKKSPTFHFMQAIDIEEAWPTFRTALCETYDLLCRVAQSFQLDHAAMSPSATFGSALDQSVNLIDRIMLFLETVEATALSGPHLQTVDSDVLQAQKNTTLLQNRVMAEFVYTRSPTA